MPLGLTKADVFVFFLAGQRLFNPPNGFGSTLLGSTPLRVQQLLPGSKTSFPTFGGSNLFNNGHTATPLTTLPFFPAPPLRLSSLKHHSPTCHPIPSLCRHRRDSRSDNRRELPPITDHRQAAFPTDLPVLIMTPVLLRLSGTNSTTLIPPWRGGEAPGVTTRI